MPRRITPSLCGEFLIDKRSMVAFTWSITTVLTLFAFITAVALSVKVHSHYNYLEKYYEGDDWYQGNEDYYNYDNSQDGDDNNNNNNNNGNDNSHDEKYREQVRESNMLLSSMSAKSITFVAVYTMMLATSLSCYGSMAIVGFTSLRGVYIAPCFSIGSNKLRVGIFGGAIVIFANLLLVCAVVLGEVKVADSYYNDREKEEEEENNNGDGENSEPYQVEQIATILAVTCIFLSALYTIFAVLLFLCHAGEEQSILRIEQGRGGVGVGSHLGQSMNMNMSNPHNQHHRLNNHQSGVSNRGHLETIDATHFGASGKTNPLVVGQEQASTLVNSTQGFITMDNSSQGTSD